MKKVYSIWTEDEQSWARKCNNPRVFKTKKAAQEALEEYVFFHDVEWWLNDGLAFVYEIAVK